MAEENVLKISNDIFGPQRGPQIQAVFLAFNENRRNGIVVMILMIISSPARIGWLLYTDRLTTTQRLAGVEGSTAQRLASSGWFVDESQQADGGERQRQLTLVCFCCEAEANDANETNLQHRADCLAARLVSLAEVPPTSPEWPAAADAAVRRHLPAIRRLRLLLDSPVVGSAASYGFELAFLRICLARQYLRSAAVSSGIERPGDLLRLAQLVEDTDPGALTVARRFDLCRLIDSCLIDSSAPAAEQPRPAPPSSFHSGGGGGGGVVIDGFAVGAFSPPSVSATVGGAPMLDSSAGEAELDDRCIRCRSRTRNRVTLPCAHFLLCDRCLEPLTRCPKCNAGIAASVTAFIT